MRTKLATILGLLAATLTLATPASAAQIWAAGDVAEDNAPGTQAITAGMIPSTADYVFMLGDGAYTNGTQNEYDLKYNPSWGAGGIFFSITRPVTGNHDYLTTGAGGYRAYFNEPGGPGNQGGGTNGCPYVCLSGPLYYSFSQGGWLYVFLDSDDALNGGTTPSAQYTWLKNTLNASTQACTAVMFHRPRYVSDTTVDGYGAAGAAFTLMANKHVDVVLNGHAHLYERSVPINGAGTPTAGGITEIVVGTGGASLHTFDPAENPAIFPTGQWDDTDHGVLKFVTSPGQWTTKFYAAPAPGTLKDSDTNVLCNAK